MHELSVCQALLQQVTDIAIKRGASAVNHVTIEAGALSGIEPALLARAFEVLRAGSWATSQATLRIESPELTIRCCGCNVESIAAPNRLICRSCGDFRTRVVAGDELRLRRIELRMPEAPAMALNQSIETGNTPCARPVVAA